MFTSRTLSGNTLLEMLNPAFRIVDFSDSPAVITVSHYLRLAWGFAPDESYSCDEEGIGRFMRETQARTQAEALVTKKGEVEGEEEGGEEEEDLEEEAEEVPVMLEEEVDESASESEDVKEIASIAPKTEIIIQETSQTETNNAPDQETEHQTSEGSLTEWQLAILAFWNHVFWDVMQFLPHVGMGIGHFHSPSHSSLCIPFLSPPTSTATSTLPAPDSSITTTKPTPFKKQNPALTHTFQTNTLLIPTYLAPGIKLRMTTGHVSTQEVLGKFTHDSKTECWWLRQGVEVSFYIDSGPSSLATEITQVEGKGKVAAVLAIGVLCDAMHEEAVEAIEAEEVQQEILEAEMQIEADGPVLEVY